MSSPYPPWPPRMDPLADINVTAGITRGPRRRTPALHAVAGALLGACLAGAAWTVTALIPAAAQDAPGADAAAACEILDRVPDVAADTAAFDLGYGYRLEAASDLAAAAADGDLRFQPLADAAKTASRAVLFNDVRSAAAHVRAARRYC